MSREEQVSSFPNAEDWAELWADMDSLSADSRYSSSQPRLGLKPHFGGCLEPDWESLLDD